MQAVYVKDVALVSIVRSDFEGVNATSFPSRGATPPTRGNECHVSLRSSSTLVRVYQYAPAFGVTGVKMSAERLSRLRLLGILQAASRVTFDCYQAVAFFRKVTLALISQSFFKAHEATFVHRTESSVARFCVLRTFPVSDC